MERTSGGCKRTKRPHTPSYDGPRFPQNGKEEKVPHLALAPSAPNHVSWRPLPSLPPRGKLVFRLASACVTRGLGWSAAGGQSSSTYGRRPMCRGSQSPEFQTLLARWGRSLASGRGWCPIARRVESTLVKPRSLRVARLPAVPAAAAPQLGTTAAVAAQTRRARTMRWWLEVP